MAMTNSEFKLLKNRIKKTKIKLEKLQKKHIRETGKRL